MKKIIYIVLLLFVFNFGYGQTTLTAGDIAFIGYNADNPDEFSFVLLTDVTNTTTINFTDNGWQNSGSFRNNEGVLTWEATSDLTCGTEIVITDINSNNYSATSGTATETNNGFSLSISGDQILAYQGTIASPTFIAAIHFATSTPTGWTNATSSNTSAIPAGLTNGVDAIYAGNFDNGQYDCSVTTNTPYILAAVNDSNNWNVANNPRFTLTNTCSFTCNPCLSTVTWNGSWSGARDLTTEVIIAANYNTSAGDFQACSLTVNAGVTLTVDNNSFIEVENDVVVNGTLIVQTEGNFVQNGDLGAFTVNVGGVARVNKQTPVKAAWYYYTYWSSPVLGETIGDAFPSAPTDRRFWFNAANFVDNNGDDIDDNDDDWQIAGGGDTMTPGVGYAATESEFHIPGATGTASFEGDFNTGDVPVSIALNAMNTGVNWNFIGNPYASAIDFVAFHTANSSVVDGVAYLWSQASPPDEGNLGNEDQNFNLNDYATFTVGTGGVAGGVAGKIPTGNIASAQGFFIPALSTGTVTFTNAMRLADDTSNGQFFKSTRTKKSNANTNFENKLWIDLTSDNGIFNQVLIGYVDGATDQNDGMSYDAPKLIPTDFAAALYTLADTDTVKYVIQGKNINSIDENEIIKLGFITNVEVPTEYTLSLAQIEGDFLTSNSIYLIDHLLNSSHNLSASNYTFTSEPDEFNDRFEIVFNEASLSIDDVALNSKSLKINELEDNHVQFTIANNLSIKSVSIYDLLGRQLYRFKGHSHLETYNLSNLRKSIYIAKVELSNGATITKKALKR
ncbi:hypothetical protein GCM10023311_12960 [Flaviramulus aquimarinus]|uniref:T9SS type A sorting domain-containing protein n=1 Tax=Flaviramulus aquimarinus TaxID=1170456 RepID=A0ABP9EYF4_9FLAO